MTFRTPLLSIALFLSVSLTVKADDNFFEPFFFALAADPHISKFDNGVPSRLAEMRQRINAIKPAFLIMAGDLLNESSPSLYQKYNLSMQDFQVPVYSIPGNHDIDPTRFPAATIDAYHEQVGPDHYRITYKNCDFYFLNSVIMRDRATYAAEYDRQWDWLRGNIANTTGRTHTFFVCHHPPFLERTNEGGGDLTCCNNGYFNWPPTERSMLLSLLAAAGGSIVFAGHFHRDRAVTHSGYTMHAPTGPQFDFDHDFARQTLTWRIIKVLGHEVQSIKMVYGATDTTPPAPPQNVRAFRQTNGTVMVECDAASDNTGVLFYDLYCEGEPMRRAIQTSIPAIIPAADAEHEFTIRAVDPYGNQSAPSSPLFFEDTPLDTGTRHWAEYR